MQHVWVYGLAVSRLCLQQHNGSRADEFGGLMSYGSFFCSTHGTCSTYGTCMVDCLCTSDCANVGQLRIGSVVLQYIQGRRRKHSGSG